MWDAVDVAVVGGGPAGAAAACTLAGRGRRVLLLEGTRYDAPRVGESLAPRLHPLLDRLGVAGDLRALGPVPSHGTASAWGDGEVRAQSFMFSPYGPGWHVDRRRVDQALAGAAARAGARVATGVRVRGVRPDGAGGWVLDTAGAGSVHARALVDAGGRCPALAGRLGGRRMLADHLVGAAAHLSGPAHAEGGFALVEAVEDGWWYSAPLPEGGFVAIFMTDADLLARRGAGEASGWSRALAGAPHTAARLAGLRPAWGPRVFSAVSHVLRRGGMDGVWLAAGDARAAVDPLSASGVFRALQGGEEAAAAVDRWLDGDSAPARAYEAAQDRAFVHYLHQRRDYYAQETRWPDAPFWRRRAALPSFLPDRPRSTAPPAPVP
ncbi:MAG TPA: tryptophan 7-halogenase [Longimicrobium sp.]|uniref:tryptophan 7-halogenase n=1 Tax=Longimicrobium sp. TaxID=2029185 RepID=UPI002EDA27D0